MDPRLQQAAEYGSIDELYALIEENPYILENFDVVPFIDTPLHVAATSGNIAFAMELMNLKPSFARKLNTRGYSPLHLAVENDQGNLVTRMLWLDHSLVHVKGRNGMSPFLLLVERGNADLVAKCLDYSPECIKDVSLNRQNALHLAVMNGRFEILQGLTDWIQKNDQQHAHLIEVDAINKADFNLNTPLHLAGYKNDHQAVRLLLECRTVEENKLNGDGLTFLDIFRNQRQTTSGDLRTGEDMDLEQTSGCKHACSFRKSKTSYDISKSSLTFWTFRSTLMRRARSWASGEDRGIFLVVCILIITATYQTALQPPGGVHQSENADKNVNAGSVVMKQTFYILVWIFNTLGFCLAMLFTYWLIPPSSLISVWFYWVGTYLCVSYALAMAVISPHPLLFLSATFAFFLFFAICVFLGVPLFLLRHYFRRRLAVQLWLK